MSESLIMGIVITTACCGVAFAVALVYTIVHQHRLLSKITTELLAASMVVSDNPLHRACLARDMVETTRGPKPPPHLSKKTPLPEPMSGIVITEGNGP